MTQGDRMLQALARLPLIQPDAEWEKRVRARCHSAITRHASRRGRAVEGVSGTGLIGPIAATVLCTYLIVMFAEAARLAGLVQ